MEKGSIGKKFKKLAAVTAALGIAAIVGLGINQDKASAAEFEEKVIDVAPIGAEIAPQGDSAEVVQGEAGISPRAFFCKNYSMRSAANFSENMSMCINSGVYGQVAVTLQIPNPALITAQYNWQMQLQRHDGKKWYVVGERTGYTSAISKSDRTFTNIATKNEIIRIAINTADYYGQKTIISEFWK